MSRGEVRIQKMLLPAENQDRCGLYYTGTDIAITENGIYIPEIRKAEFFTYFNGFFISQWKRYTQIRNPFLEVSVQGNCKIELWYQDRKGHSVLEEEKQCTDIGHSKTVCLQMPSWKKAEIYWVCLEGRKGGAVLKDFSIWAESAEVRSVNCAAVICTCRREAEAAANIAEIKKLEAEVQPEVFLVDNGNTMGDCEFPEFVKYIPNKNCGGAGGFTRGMLEAVKRECFTHVILMDDDISLEPGVLERTKVFLSVLKKEYETAELAGSLLRKDAPWVQFECGALWNRGRIKALGNGYDLRERQSLVANMENPEAEYGGWWYCCIPVKEIISRGYPLPLFIHRDDIEYGLRLGQVITLNGIGVWHEAVTRKLPQAGEYYDIRNMSIVNAIHVSDHRAGEWKKFLMKWIIGNILRGRYEYIQMNLLAVRDFLRGEQWLADSDGVEINRRIMELLPALRTEEQKEKGFFYAPADVSVYKAAGKKKIIYEDPSGKTLRVEKRSGQTIKALRSLLQILCISEKEFESAKSSYQKKWKELITDDFWRNYLECE